MKVCIIGDGLVSLTLAKVLIQKNISVDILSSGKLKKYDNNRTLGISRSNVKYFNEKIVNIEKILWGIKNIKVYSENLPNREILNFSNNDEQVFSVIKNQQLYQILTQSLKKNKLIKFIKVFDNKKYNLIINCNPNHKITKKFFSNKVKKKYYSHAYTTIIKHERVNANNTAIQIFTKNGPVAFLPMSQDKTSVVYSFKKNNFNSKEDIKNLIIKFNPIYKINKIEECSKFELNFSSLRNYYKNNILAFGDLLHQIHPLAGQGFNMSLRDIAQLSKLIDDKINIGLELDSSICLDFQKKIQNRNLFFSLGIDWIYELFKFENYINTNLISKSANIIGKNKFMNTLFKKFADNGLKV